MQLRLLQQVLLSVLPICPGVSLVTATSLFQNGTRCITAELFRYSRCELLVLKPASAALLADGGTERGQLHDRIPCLEAKMICGHTNLPST